jgi:hypothetical protein
MQFNLNISPLTVAKRLTSILIVLAVLSIAVQISKYVFNYRSDWMDMVNLDREMNLPTWFEAFMLVFCSYLLRIIAAGKRNESSGDSRRWQLLSNIFIFLAIDEIISIHEILIIPKLAKTLHIPNFLAQIWVIPGVIATVFLIKYYWKFLNRLPGRSRFHFLLAGAIYIGGALGMEMVGSAYSKIHGQQNFIYALLATVEEVMEKIGTVIFIYSLLSYLENWNNEIDFKIKIGRSEEVKGQESRVKSQESKVIKK